MILAIIGLVLTVINFIIYHSIFKVYYFGNLGNHLFAEFAGCFFVAGIEIALFQMLLPYIVIVGSVIGVILFVLTIVGKLLNKENDNDAGTADPINNTYSYANTSSNNSTYASTENSQANQSKPKVDEPAHVQENNIVKEDAQESTVHFSPEQFEYQRVDDEADTGDTVDDTTSKEPVEISTEPIIVDKPVQTEVIEDVFCTSCGKKIPGNSAFCTYCGQRNKYQIGGLA